jgi:hypothetical protein
VSDLGRVREMSDDSTATVELAQIDAMELAELCSFIEVWLTGADSAVAASLDRYVGAPGYSLFKLRNDLARWAELLMTRSPKP